MPRRKWKADPRLLTPDELDVLRQEVLGGYYDSCGGFGCNGGEAQDEIKRLLNHIDALQTTPSPEAASHDDD
jgi:hypothetical protein